MVHHYNHKKNLSQLLDILFCFCTFLINTIGQIFKECAHIFKIHLSLQFIIVFQYLHCVRGKQLSKCDQIRLIRHAVKNEI